MAPGPDQVLPSVFDVTGLAAGVVGAATSRAAALQELRSGRPSEVHVDRFHAAMAFRSERYVRVDGAAPPSPWDAASGYYPTGDGGLVQIHANFPHHRAGALALLGIDDPGDAAVHDAIAAAAGGWRADELEDRAAAVGVPLYRLRTTEEWHAHPQAAAVADLPVVEVIRVGAAEPRPLPEGDGALSGVRVLDQTRVIAGPVATRTLAAHGAEVVRIGAPHLPVVSPILADTCLGKRWIDLDLRRQGDRDRFLQLADDADVVVQGYRPGSLDSLGVGPQALIDRRPGLICAVLSAFSHRGPWSTRRGFDSLVQTATGVGAAGAQAAGVTGTRPLPAQALDHGAGWILAAGIMEALRRRAVDGGSWLVRTSLVQVRTLLGSLGPVDALALDDPGFDDAAPLMVETTGPDGRTVGHVALPGTLDGRSVRWRDAGEVSPGSWAGWSPRR